MKVAFKIPSGRFCDREDSWRDWPGAEKFLGGPNVVGRFGGTVDDYEIREVPDDIKPNEFHLSGDKLVKLTAEEFETLYPTPPEEST